MSEAMFRFMSKNGGDGCGGRGGGGGGGGLALEVTVLSAESLRLPPPSYYSLIPRRLRPYVTVSSAASACSTDVAEGASGEHSWNDTLVVPVGAEFLESRGGGGGGGDVHVAVYSEPACRLVGGATPLGWCRIPAADVLDGLRPPRALRRLSYSLRCPRSGGPARGVVHLAVRVLGDLVPPPPPQHAPSTPAQPGWCRVAMGIPVSGTSAAATAAVVGMPAWAWGGEASR
uniref:C2 domain-containing protein n=1 Tax=Oryza punctata TaxID=4537 RepID=A0A0E0L798_ORYPU